MVSVFFKFSSSRHNQVGKEVRYYTPAKQAPSSYATHCQNNAVPLNAGGNMYAYTKNGTCNVAKRREKKACCGTHKGGMTRELN